MKCTFSYLEISIAEVQHVQNVGNIENCSSRTNFVKYFVHTLSNVIVPHRLRLILVWSNLILIISNLKQTINLHQFSNKKLIILSLSDGLTDIAKANAEVTRAAASMVKAIIPILIRATATEAAGGSDGGTQEATERFVSFLDPFRRVKWNRGKLECPLEEECFNGPYSSRSK